MSSLSLNRDSIRYLSGLLSELERLYAKYLDKHISVNSDKIVTIYFDKAHLIGVIRMRTRLVSARF